MVNIYVKNMKSNAIGNKEEFENFLNDMRILLGDGERFKDLYCEINHITSYDHILDEEPGETSYINLFNPKKSLEERP